ncbi:MAG TPA: hypothetical protein VN845_11240, partial [Solirubrobacteraceae bacterium]|nr:hypothetical protein [Solirubrobacteraceae bacterium]
VRKPRIPACPPRISACNWIDRKRLLPTPASHKPKNLRQRDTQRAVGYPDPDVDALVSWFADWWLRCGRDLMAKDRKEP